jgi:hypothetical protein
MSLWSRGMAADSTPVWFLDSASPAAWQLMDEGVATFHAPRLIRPGGEEFCRLLAVKAAQLRGVRRVQLCTVTSVWRIEFSTEMLGVEDISAHPLRSVREALPALKTRESGDGFAMTWVAFPNAAGPASVWEIVTEAPGRFQLRSRRLRRRPVVSARVAGFLEQVCGVRKCRARGWTGTLEVEIDEAMVSLLDLATSAEELSRRMGRPGIWRTPARTGRGWLIQVQLAGSGIVVPIPARALACASLVRAGILVIP